MTYQGFEFRIEVKSLQTNSIKMFEPAAGRWMKKVVERPMPKVAGKRQKKKWEECELYRTEWRRGGADARYTGSVQCDASDNREVLLPNGRRVQTTNLVVGEFDILAMGLFAFRERWEFGFMLNREPAPIHPREVRGRRPAAPAQDACPGDLAARPGVPPGPVPAARPAGGRETADLIRVFRFWKTRKYEWFLRACSWVFSRLTPARLVRTTTNRSLV